MRSYKIRAAILAVQTSAAMSGKSPWKRNIAQISHDRDWRDSDEGLVTTSCGFKYSGHHTLERSAFSL